MKKILFFLTMSLSFFVLNAQKYETIKNQLVFNKYKEAKVELDKAMSNPKFTSNAEAYLLKTTIYAGLSMEEPRGLQQETNWRWMLMPPSKNIKKWIRLCH
jgi:hypothetical protein